jgi:pilus assembly protein CpaF
MRVVPCGVLVSGPPAAGKTSCLDALVGAIPRNYFVAVCEDGRELATPLALGQYFDTRPSTDPDVTDVDLRLLVRLALRVRPRVIVVGEVRGAESYELTRAGNAGCSVLCTVHSSSAAEALNALTDTALMAGEHIRDQYVRRRFSRILHLVVHLDLDPDQPEGILRRVTEIAAVPPLQAADNDYTLEPLFTRADLDGPLEWTGRFPPPELTARLDRMLRHHGLSTHALLAGEGSLL